MPNPQIPIPAGFRQIQIGERVRAGDKIMRYVGRDGKTTFQRVISYGFTHRGNAVFIRKTPPPILETTINFPSSWSAAKIQTWLRDHNLLAKSFDAETNLYTLET